MARVKNTNNSAGLSGVADGFNFDIDIKDTPEEYSSEPARPVLYSEIKQEDPFFVPPKRKRGRPRVKEDKKIYQFSIGCTLQQKERYIEAAEREGKSLSYFINWAVQEYIRNHNL